MMDSIVEDDGWHPSAAGEAALQDGAPSTTVGGGRVSHSSTHSRAPERTAAQPVVILQEQIKGIIIAIIRTLGGRGAEGEREESVCGRGFVADRRHTF